MTVPELESLLDEWAKVLGDVSRATGKLAEFFESLKDKPLLMRLLATRGIGEEIEDA